MTDGSAPHPPTTTGGEHPPTPVGRRRAPVRTRRRLAAAGLAGLAVVVAVTLAVRGGAAPACAAPPRAGLPLAAPPVGGATYTGKATFYDSEGAGGNCSRPAAPANRLYVALGPSEYAAGAACGGFLDVTGPRGTVRVLVMDQCPECAPGHLDLSAEAFARIADPVQGVVKVSYRAVVNPSLPGPLTFRLKEGASQWWFAVLVGDHGNPLRSVEVRQNGAWRAADRQDYNYWLIASGAGPGPYSIRVTDVYGHRATATGIRMLPGQVQRSTTRMYGAGAATTAARAAKPSRSPSARATPKASVSPSPTPSAAPAEPDPTLIDAVAPATPSTVPAACG
ncbi:expansin EXLX1 family cellulose-binding protein [Micromonospora sp. WMMC241]|uniref:expansin EXLX1 family cellulose-binding protein n=1 Tax=Micromonospora sp. WMMC241 TaxID=3015159 RepID=UPI0022B69F45|nr:expansin EXLX1 family cellulose-binding protein [Micromonospora sp. WMMC241]MCZ7439413.1 expansin EXLX1 family cellulose-binding protein [Micromonospora sp. WMMC241]